MGVFCLISYTYVCVIIGLSSTWYQGVLAVFFGTFVAYHENECVEKFTKNKVIMICISACLMICMNLLTFNIVDVPFSGTVGAICTPLFTASTMIFIIACFSKNSFPEHNIGVRFLMYLGRKSYYIYLLHELISVIFEKYIHHSLVIFVLTIFTNCLLIYVVEMLVRYKKRCHSRKIKSN